MSTLTITLIAIGAFLAGYLLRGLLAVMWERKRKRTESAWQAGAGFALAQLRTVPPGIVAGLTAAMPEVFDRQPGHDNR